MMYRYGTGWIQFPERVWEPSGKNLLDQDGNILTTIYSSREATHADRVRREEIVLRNHIEEVEE